jgi:uncharacterized protein YjbJ (UPF0337 family)
MMVEENPTAGQARDDAGKAQEAAGDMLGDTATQAHGKFNEYAGKAQHYAGQAQDKAQETLGATLDQARDLGDQLTETTKDRPLTTLLVVGAVGFALGYLLRG